MRKTRANKRDEQGEREAEKRAGEAGAGGEEGHAACEDEGRVDEDAAGDNIGSADEGVGADGAGDAPGAEGTDGDGGSEGADADTDDAGADGPGEGESADVKYLRLAADFQNYKKRMEKERFERYSEGKKDFAADILPVLDNFDRALGHDAGGGGAAKETELDTFVEGMELILKQFQDALAKNGVNEIEALGEAFDPNVHHAVLMEPSGEYESQKVSEVLMKGYRIGDKVIRPTMVKVAE